jgi:hypothetical protein
MSMSRYLALPALVLLTGCMVESRPGGGLELVPMLPAVVEVGPDGYYAHQGYHYFYTGGGWYYSDRRDGVRRELPRSHWPREVRRRDH